MTDLAAILKAAYSGELAAAHAYRGHAASVRDPEERRRILEIRLEELDHRRQVGEMLEAMGERPSRWLEFKFAFIGRTIGALCHIGGWFIPMYGAGRLERGNILEYEVAAQLADRGDFIEALLRMADVEREHEAYFRGKAASHWMARFIPIWNPPASVRHNAPE